MKVLTVFLAIVVLLALVGCGDDFDEEAEKEAVAAVSVGIDDGITKGDREAVIADIHDDMTMFTSFPDDYSSTAFKDWSLDAFTEPFRVFWKDYDVMVSQNLAVMKGNRTNMHPEYGAVPVFGTAVFTKEDGQWKLNHSHMSYAGP